MKRILIAAPVKQTEDIFIECLKGIDNLVIPEGYEVDKFFMLHGCEHLSKYLKKGEYQLVQSGAQYKVDEITHHWNNQNLTYVRTMKNDVLKKVKEENYDYVFFIDSDLIVHPDTLKWLLEANKDIVSELFWTKWAPENDAQPNAWIFDSYTMYDDSFPTWREPGLYRVGMTGACILIKRSVIEAGVNYNPIENVSYSSWEDRAFCIRAAVAGFEIWTDTHVEPIHLYRKSEYNAYVDSGGYPFGRVSDMTMEEIDEEIAKARTERRDNIG